RRQVDLGIGLAQPAVRRERLGVEEPRELALRPGGWYLFRTDGYQSELDATLPQRDERLVRASAQAKCAPCELMACGDMLRDVFVGDAQRAVRVCKRSGLRDRKSTRLNSSH